MRIKNIKDHRKQQVGLAAVILLPVALLGAIFGTASYLYVEIPSFGMDESKMPDISSFQLVDYGELASMAAFYDQRFEGHHIPLNYTVSASFTSTNYTNVSTYGFSDNGALWSGTAIAGYVGKYLAARRESNATMELDALRVIRKLVHGMSMMLAVPNGGLGPGYGAILARMWAAPEHASIPGMPLFNDSIQGARAPYAYYNGSGVYSNWRYSDFTSLDEYGGYYWGLAITYKYVDDPWVRGTLSLMIDQLCSGMLQTNFLGIGGFGGPTGVDQKMRFLNAATWSLLLLKMGALAYPDKYARLYYHFAVERGYAFFANEGGTQEIVANYYAYNFGIDVVFGLLLLEEDPTLRAQYLANFNNGMWSFVRTHRNAHFNVIHLIVEGLGPGGDVYYERDVEDQLARFKLTHYPDVNAPVTPPTPDYRLVDFTVWQNFFERHPLGNFMAPFFFEFELDNGDKEDKGFYDRPLAVDMCKTRLYIWGGNPFTIPGNSTNLLVELPGLSFITPYWLMRGFGLINATGVRSP
ncbi:MAG: hypothetical protein JW839_06020 [Candidatus Lokiarchaeota archaeon]|nr:hypothetical protein [Candidatus Lokiarchaeota archaeon]